MNTEKNKNGTSLVEQSLFYFIKKNFPDAVNRYSFRCLKHYVEIDIYIPSLDMAVEYDGSYWHKSKVDSDNKKNGILNENGFSVLRIREFGLPELEKFNGDVINLPYIQINEKNYDYINTTLAYISKQIGEPLSSEIKKNFVDDTVYTEALREIYALRYSCEVFPNLTSMCGIEFWSYELSAPLKPQNIEKYTWVPAHLVCSEGRDMILPRYRRCFRSENEEDNQCDKCVFDVLCPLMRFCNDKISQGEKGFSDEVLVECKYVENKIWQFIEEGKSLEGYSGFPTFHTWLTKSSTIGKKLLKAYTSSRTSKKVKENIVFFMGLQKETYREYLKMGCI